MTMRERKMRYRRTKSTHIWINYLCNIFYQLAEINVAFKDLCCWFVFLLLLVRHLDTYHTANARSYLFTIYRHFHVDLLRSLSNLYRPVVINCHPGSLLCAVLCCVTLKANIRKIIPKYCHIQRHVFILYFDGIYDFLAFVVCLGRIYSITSKIPPGKYVNREIENPLSKFNFPLQEAHSSFVYDWRISSFTSLARYGSFPNKLRATHINEIETYISSGFQFLVLPHHTNIIAMTPLPYGIISHIRSFPGIFCQSRFSPPPTFGRSLATRNLPPPPLSRLLYYLALTILIPW